MQIFKSLNYNCPEHVMKFAEEVWTYFLGKFSDGLLGRHQKFFSHLPSTFHRNKVSHVYLFTNTWVVSSETRLESSGLITILGLVTLRMRKADQVPCCKKVKQFYLLVLCPMDKWSLTRLVRNYHPALMSGCEGRHLMTFVIFDCDCLPPCLPPWWWHNEVRITIQNKHGQGPRAGLPDNNLSSPTLGRTTNHLLTNGHLSNLILHKYCFFVRKTFAAQWP